MKSINPINYKANTAANVQASKYPIAADAEAENANQ